MKFLIIILSVMSFLVETKNSVTQDGTCPHNMEAFYSCSYQKGTVRKGDNATLTLSHLDGITIEKISVFLKANKQSGAGTFTVMADDRLLANRSVAYREIIGEGGNAYVSWAIYSGSCANVDELTISLDGTENSLYIDKYEITWASPSPRSVTLMNGSSEYAVMTERTSGAGVVLPALPDTAEWRFIGWSETEIRSTTKTPMVLPAYAKYYPREDTYLWATYKQQLTQETTYMTEPETGIYLYVNRQIQIALSGVPENGIMYPAALNTNDEDQYYEITFASPDTAYITHVSTGAPIGYEAAKLAIKPSPWQVYHDGEETLFYTTYNKQTYVLWLNIADGSVENFHAGLIKTNPGSSPVALQRVPDQSNEPLYSCHPENPQSITTVPTIRNQYTIPFGIYELQITNGQKQLIIR